MKAFERRAHVVPFASVAFQTGPELVMISLPFTRMMSRKRWGHVGGLWGVARLTGSMLVL